MSPLYSICEDIQPRAKAYVAGVPGNDQHSNHFLYMEIEARVILFMERLLAF